MKYSNVYELIRTEEANYQTQPITILENWDWLMYEHIRRTVLFKNSQYTNNSYAGTLERPFKNIIRPILNLQYRTEGFDVKDIQLYVDENKNYYKSFITRKFHDKWARENEIDTFIDNLVESYVDFGGALVKNLAGQVAPSVVPLQRIAFADQTGLLSGPICEKHFYSPDELEEAAKKGWENIDEVIFRAEYEKTGEKFDTRQNKTPGKYIEVYEVHGVFPSVWLEGTDYYETVTRYESKNYERQVWICTFYTDEQGRKNGIVLYKGIEKKLPYKLLLRDEIYGRALGLGGAEELFQPQVFTNLDVIRMNDMLSHASKVVYQTSDLKYKNRNRLTNIENGEILTHDPGAPLAQLNTSPINISLFERAVFDWENHAKITGGATEAILGQSPSAGTPFKLQELVVQEARSLHEYRRGKIAVFIDEVYRDWIMPYIKKEIVKDQEFLAELDFDEMKSVSDSVVQCETNKMLKEAILSGNIVDNETVQMFKDSVRRMFIDGGNKKFIKVFKEEMANLPLQIKINIQGKQKDLAGKVDKLVNIFRTIVSAPQVLSDPKIAKLFNEILEYSGLSPLDYNMSSYDMAQPQPQAQAQPNSATQSLQKLPEAIAQT